VIIKLGPLTLMDSKTRAAYARLANEAYGLHTTIWYAEDLGSATTQELLRNQDAQLSEALSHTPPEDIQSSE